MNKFVLTGLPRSGSSITSTIICEDIENAYCVNECFYDVDNLGNDLKKAGNRLIVGLPVPNKYHDKGLVTNIHENERIDWRVVEKEFDDNLQVGSKVQTPYLTRLPSILKQDIKVLAIIRHPLFTIGSWTRGKTEDMEVADPDNIRWRHWVKFKETDTIGRQAELWEQQALIVQHHHRRKEIEVIRYEDLVKNPEQLGYFLDRDVSKVRKLKSMNLRDRYEKIDEIEKKLHLCPTMKYFGYK